MVVEIKTFLSSKRMGEFLVFSSLWGPLAGGSVDGSNPRLAQRQLVQLSVGGKSPRRLGVAIGRLFSNVGDIAHALWPFLKPHPYIAVFHYLR